MKAVPDPRCGRTSKHDHAEVLVCLVTGFLAGRLTIRRSLKWCRKHLEWLRQYLPLKNGVASPSTACRILAGIDEELFALQFTAWIGEIVETTHYSEYEKSGREIDYAKTRKRTAQNHHFLKMLRRVACGNG